MNVKKVTYTAEFEKLVYLENLHIDAMNCACYWH